MAGETATDPEIALAVEKPAPEQEVALVELQLIVEACPAMMLLGVALSEAVGGLATVIVAFALAEPLAPVQVSE